MLEVSQSVTLLSFLIHHPGLSKKILAVGKKEYFESDTEAVIFDVCSKYINTYHSLPPKEALSVDIDNISNIKEDTVEGAKLLAKYLYSQDIVNYVCDVEDDWATKQIESFCKNRALYLAITQSIEIIGSEEDKKQKLDKGIIPKLLQDALSISMETGVGHDYVNDAEHRYESYVAPEQRIKSGIYMMDQILGGGFVRPSMNVLISGTGVGKSMTMCSMAAALLMQGYDVLYISLEMPENQVGRRIDANLLDVDYDKVELIPRDRYLKRMEDLRTKSGIGSIVIKSWPPSTVGVNQFRALVQDIKVKKGFVPQVFILDYLAIAQPSSIKGSDNLYIKTKYVAEEFRALCFEYHAVGITAAQSNKGAQGASDFDLTEVGEGHSLSMTADTMWGLIVTDQLEQMGQMRIKVLKNRHGSTTDPSSFLASIERSKMRVSNTNDYSSMPRSSTVDNPGYGEDNTPTPNFKSSPSRTKESKKKFADFKIDIPEEDFSFD